MTGRAHAGMGNTSPTSVVFSYSDITAQTKKTVTTTNFTSSLTGSLLGDLSLAVNVGPLGLPIPGLGGTVKGIIGGATALDRSGAGVGAGDARRSASGRRMSGCRASAATARCW